MKIGFIGLNDLPGVEEDARFAAENGFDGIEYDYWQSFEELTAETVKQMRAILDKHGAYASSLGLWGWNHLAPDADERGRSLGYLDRAIEFAQMLGARVLITGGGNIPAASPAENAAEFLKVFPPYLEKAQRAGLKVAMYLVHGGSFFAGVSDFLPVWKQLPEIGIKLDPANIRHHGDDYLPILRDAGDKIYHVHIKEHLYMAGQLASQPPAGMGDIQWGKVMAFLYEHNYTGNLTIEPHGPIWSKPPFRRKMLLLTQRHISQFIV